MKIYIDLAPDRDAVVTILAKNGYTVRQGREKQGSKYIRYVEYWKGGGPGDGNTGADRPD